jgi:hypothetical protein
MEVDRQLLVDNLSPPMQVHTSEVFLDPERQGKSFVYVMRNCWCVQTTGVPVIVCVCVCIESYISIMVFLYMSVGVVSLKRKMGFGAFTDWTVEEMVTKSDQTCLGGVRVLV